MNNWQYCNSWNVWNIRSTDIS